MENLTLTPISADFRLTPGMVAAVEIKTGTRKLIEYVLSPLMRMGDEAGRER
ncbi:MAG: hypothetical protein HYU58_18240 [Proteobacteria bacterium]|nr:hypothetical protein [Pseudomonadota bacterium]